MVPKRIIQTGPPNLPLILKAAIASVTSLHPTFEYLFFDDGQIESFLESHFPQYKSAFHSFPVRVQKYDFFRYLAIYHYGGFYLDLDVFLAHDLTPLLTCDCVFPFEELTEITYFWHQFGMDWQIGNYAFGAAPGHPFLKAVIENCIRARENPSWVTPMFRGIPKPFRAPYFVTNTTGPGLVSRTLAENPQFAGQINILFPEDVRDPSTWHQFGDYGVHHMVGSWRRRSALSSALIKLWEKWSARRVTAHSKGTGKTRALAPRFDSTASPPAHTQALS